MVLKLPLNYVIDRIVDPENNLLYLFAYMSVLEDIIYTIKYGQYLRWDHHLGCHLKAKISIKGGFLHSNMFSIVNSQ